MVLFNWMTTIFTPCLPQSLLQHQGFCQHQLITGWKASPESKANMQSFPVTLTLCTPAIVTKNCSSNTVTLLPPILKLRKLHHSLSQTLGRLDEWFRDRKGLPWKGSSSEDVVSLSSLNSSFLHAICVSGCIEDVATLCRKYSGEWAHFYPGLVFVTLWKKRWTTSKHNELGRPRMHRVHHSNTSYHTGVFFSP